MTSSPPAKFATLAIHAGRKPDPATGAIIPPIHLSTTFERDADASYPRGFVYTRSENPNRDALETALCALEGGKSALVFASGMAAMSALLQSYAPQTHVLVCDDLYHGTRHLLSSVMQQWGLDITFADMTDIPSLKAHIQQSTRLILCETPSNPMLKLVDIRALSTLAYEHGALLAVDSTWTTPALQQPLALGADIVMHSTTKYLGGHSDILGGALIFKDNTALLERVRTVQQLSGGVPSPFDCWLLLRSLCTLPYRMQAHCDHAMQLATFLHAHPKVKRVHYPGLPSHPQHTLAKTQMQDFGGMLSVQIGPDDNDAQSALACLAHVNVFARATSLGGVESLVEHRASIEGPDSLTSQNLVRVSVGLEHPDDLITDIDAALAHA